MPLWTLQLRTLACRHPLRSHKHRFQLPAQWPTPVRLRGSYSTASPVNQHDDSRQQPPSTPTITSTTSSFRQTVPDGWHEEEVANTRPELDSLAASDIPRAREDPKITRLGNGSLFYTPWDKAYNEIKTWYTRETLEERPDVPTFHPVVAAWVDTALEHLEQGNDKISADDLSSITGADSNVAWTQIALWLLVYDQPRMLRFLLATHVKPYVPAKYVQDCLRQLGACLYHSSEPDKTSRVQELAEVFCTLAKRNDGAHLAFEYPILRIVLPHCSVEQVLHLYHVVRKHNVYAKPWTHCHIANFLAKNDCYSEALGALALAKAHKSFSVNSWAFRSICSTLLRRSMNQPEGLRETLRIVSTIVDLGVKLDNAICDIIMLNAIEAGDLRTAFDVYHSLMQHGLRPTEGTFTVLLKGCKTNIDDVQMLNEVIRDAISNINVRTSSLVADNILHCLALHHSKHHPDTALHTLTEAYAQFFDLAPLKRLGLPMREIPPHRLTTEKVMPPTPWALYYMIGASINHTLRYDLNEQQIFPLYTRWRALVEAGDPALAPLAQTDHVSNLFLSAFVRRPTGLIRGANVVKDMQRRLPATAGGIVQCKPSVMTWNIFLHGFTRHGQMRLAERVLTYMRKQGVRETTATWNTLLAGYARVQDTTGTLDVLRKGDESGAVWDRWTDSGLERLQGQSRADVEAEWRQHRREVDFTQDLKAGLGQRLGGLGPEVMDESSGDGGSVESEGGYGHSPADLAERGDERYRPF